MKRVILIVALLGSVLASCEYFVSTPEDDVIARVNDKYLYRSDIENLVAVNTSPEDSALIVNNYVNQWATQQLLIDRALVNLSQDELDRYEKLVNEYRNDLLTEAYKNAVVSKQLDSTVTQSQYEEYYERSKENYRLNDVLLKVRYIHLPVDYSGVDKVKNRLTDFDAEDKEILTDQAYSYVSSNLNDSVWIKKDNLQKVLPILRSEKSEVLKKSNFTQLQDSLGVYLIKIEDRLDLNETAPVEFVKPTLKQIILNKRKLELISKFESDITRDAVRHNKFQIYTYE